MKIIEKLKSIHRYNTITYISIFILLVTGVIPSLILSEWGWFSRSGALLVIFGIFIVWLDYESAINEDLNTIFSGFKDYLKNSDDNLKDKETDSIEQIIQDKFNELSYLTKKRFQNIEFFIVAIGTLIWGYGDLVNKINFDSSSSIEQVKQIEHNKTLERNSLP
jgi:energy-coupling factor transporter transmembrane protein EcfT